MDNTYKHNLVLFTDTFPYGAAETFLADELPYVAARFDRVIIYPLYIPTESHARQMPANVEVKEPLLSFNHKSKLGLINHGLFCGAPFFFATKEFFSRAVCGLNIPPAGKYMIGKKAGFFRRIWLFCDYFFMLRSILGNKPLMERIVRECSMADVLYFYWGDKSALITPFLKKKLEGATSIMPKVFVRFHGSDIYERAKGYLPFREMLYPSIDCAVPISYDGAHYIQKNYKHQPKLVETFHLGSSNTDEKFANLMGRLPGVFEIVSCSNVIELKRVDMIAEAIKLIADDSALVKKIREKRASEGMKFTGIHWTHFGGGPLLENLKNKCVKYFNKNVSAEKNDTVAESKNSAVSNTDSISVIVNLRGPVEHSKVLEYYRDNGANLFVLVSRTEGVPVSIMEAFSYGIPVIATNVGGVSEMFRNCPVGYLVDAAQTPETLKDYIVKYILLPKEEQIAIQNNARANWEENWNAEKNFSGFADELINTVN
ncbi:MAG: glycosyltransferase [Bacteroidales bacterium]|jgi:colanic acid/amylovoran biosynthesis glycosyltransferase|nr:glycosyltransferase [Bacteroidales bacterium]